jgi:uncharacterized protein YciI
MPNRSSGQSDQGTGTLDDGLEVPTVPYYLVLLIPDSNREAGEQHFAAHVAFIDEMTAADAVLLGGDFETAIDGAEGAYLLRAESRAEAEAWAAKDPLIRNAVYRAKVVAWRLVGISRRAIDPALSIG